MSSTTGGTVGVGAGVHRAAAQLQGGPRFAGHKNWGRSFGDHGLWWIYLYLLWLSMVYKPTYNWGAPPCWAWYGSKVLILHNIKNTKKTAMANETIFLLKYMTNLVRVHCYPIYEPCPSADVFGSVCIVLVVSSVARLHAFAFESDPASSFFLRMLWRRQGLYVFTEKIKSWKLVFKMFKRTKCRVTRCKSLWRQNS